MPPPRRSWSLSAATQRTLIFLLGLGMLVGEATIHHSNVQWPIVIAALTLLGFPIPSLIDEARAARKKAEEDE